MQSRRVVISRSRQPQADRRRLEDRLASGLAAIGFHVLVVPDICDLTPSHRAARHLAAASGDFVVAASLQPRAAEWVLRYVTGDESEPGAEVPHVRCLDLRALRDTDAAMAQCIGLAQWAGDPQQDPATGRIEDLSEDLPPRWYPVIDASRCRRCGQCAEFCLFGVFAVAQDKRVTVQNPDQCKPGCPACARVCPAAAIIFPRCEEPVIAGAEPAEAALEPPAGSAPETRDELDRLVDELEALDD